MYVYVYTYLCALHPYRHPFFVEEKSNIDNNVIEDCCCFQSLDKDAHQCVRTGNSNIDNKAIEDCCCFQSLYTDSHQYVRTGNSNVYENLI